MQVTVIGVESLSAKLVRLPQEISQETVRATEHGVELEARAIAAVTPRRTGALAASIQTSTSSSPAGAQGRVYSDLRYATFVERGTRRHGPAQRMFERGSANARGQIDGLYFQAMDRVAAGF